MVSRRPYSGIDRLRQALESGRPQRRLVDAGYEPRKRTIEQAIRIGAVVPAEAALVDGFAQSWTLAEGDDA